MKNAEVAFPVRVTFPNGESESYANALDLEQNLEHFDSDRDAGCYVVDALGRPVKLKLDTLELKELSLVDSSKGAT